MIFSENRDHPRLRRDMLFGIMLQDLTNHKAAGGIMLQVSRPSRRSGDARVSTTTRQSPDTDGEPPRELLSASPDVAAQLARWLSHLGAERRMSPKTCEAYERDVRQFLAFMAEHLGGRVTLKALAR